MKPRLMKEIAYTALFLIGSFICLFGIFSFLLGFSTLLAGASMLLGLIIACSVYIPLMHLLVR